MNKVLNSLLVIGTLISCSKRTTIMEVKTKKKTIKKVRIIDTVPACSIQSTEDGGIITCGDSEPIRIQNGTNGLDGQNGASCNVVPNEDGATIVCGDSSVVLFNGVDGEDGIDGQDGSNGEDGVDGEDGIDGQNGSDGIDGEDGQDGVDGNSGDYAIVAIHDPCGDYPGYLDEVILELANGSFLSYFNEQGGSSKQGLALLSPGLYETTDKQKCEYEITSTNQIIEGL